MNVCKGVIPSFKLTLIVQGPVSVTEGENVKTEPERETNDGVPAKLIVTVSPSTSDVDGRV